MRLPLSVIAALAGFSVLAIPLPAGAAPLSGAMPKSLAVQPQSGDEFPIVQVQRRPPPPGGRRGYRRDRGRDDGAVAAGILGGLLLGAIIANQAQQQRGVEYCIQRYRSYDPRSGTYVGYDGRRHRCP